MRILAVLVPIHMGKDTVIPSGALGGVESLAYFFASSGVGDSVSGLDDSVSGRLWWSVNWWPETACNWGFVMKGVRWFRILFRECPDIDVFLNGIPLQCQVPSSRLPEEVIVVDAPLCLVVSEEHKLQCRGWRGGNTGTKIVVPCL